MNRVLLRLQSYGGALLLALANQVALARADETAVVHSLHLLNEVHGVAALARAGRIAIATATKDIFRLRIHSRRTVVRLDIRLFGLDVGSVVIVVYRHRVHDGLFRGFVCVISIR